ncbi:MAG: hypothetical protein AB1724_10170 [Thermodesulfobacteriota bacterium]
MKKSFLIGMVVLFFASLTAISAWSADSPGTGSGMNAFEASWKKDRYALVFFYAEMDDAIKEKQAGFEAIAAGLKDKADAYFVNIKDPGQRDVVNQYKLDRAPMPLVLVIAPNGAVTGGFPQVFPEQAVKEAILGPLTAQCLKGLQDRKIVFVCVPGENAEANISAMKGVKDFTSDKMFEGQTEVVIFKDAGPSEQRLMSILGIDGKGVVDPITAMLASPGGMIGKFTGATDKDTLLTALKSKQQSGGCCPAGSGKTCK